LEIGRIADSVETFYGVEAARITYLPLGYDLNAAVYEVQARDEQSYFLKVRFDPVDETGLLVSRALLDHGIRNILAPLRTRKSDLWAPLDGYPGYTVVLYPFIRGENAMVAGMSDGQWQEFGATLRAVHDSGLEQVFHGQLRDETFALPSAALVREMLLLVESADFKGAAASRFAAFWRERADTIDAMLARAEELGRSLQTRSFEHVLCHADIHAANILVGDDGRVHLIDWDFPIIAPRERDLLFVVGSRIARAVEPREEDLFFEGYGPATIDPTALTYYRYERIVEDLGEFGKSVFLDPSLSEQMRVEAAELTMSFFAPGEDVDLAEAAPRQSWPAASTSGAA
jgi:spectinomycin phosphotransferase